MKEENKGIVFIVSSQTLIFQKSWLYVLQWQAFKNDEKWFLF